MDVLLLCGYFENKYQQEIGTKTKTWVENAANTFQQRLIKGFKKQDINLTVVSAPFIGPWPTVYQDVFFKGFEAGESDEKITYVGFNNIWGYRNISRTTALKKQVRTFIKNSHSEKKAVIVYSPHTPFLEAAVYAKSIDPSIHIHMVVPDLPQYMNLSKKAHPIYDFFKRIDIKKFYQLNRHVDSYMLLTEHMAEKMEVGDRPYIVVEAIIDEVPEQLGNGHPRGKVIAYAGKLVESFGVKRLVEAFEMIDDPEAQLQICGGGELRSYIEDMAQKDSRILYHGVVTAEKAHEILMNADVLVNPRLNDDEYTKYSFPSKNIEYLMTGNAVVAYMLDGMPEVYRAYINTPANDSIEALSEAIVNALGCWKKKTFPWERVSAKKVSEDICSLFI
ncbi:MAG: glycosyltransferase [Clostridia bacterium]|nr:glycosyltransferase [Clostridia bacterium]